MSRRSIVNGGRNVLNSLGEKAMPIPVDAKDMCMRLVNLPQPPRFICTTLSLQCPLGMLLSLSRRRTLLEYARVANFSLPKTLMTENSNTTAGH
ncbi:MAG: hypothetical protein H7240_08530 [Glaciimonas sp.]|nr:hypothetical protein [Glaciimonas sp.]